MSQIHVPSASEPPPPEVPLQFTTNTNGPAVPVANNLNLYGRETTSNDNDGIRTNNDPNGSATVYVELTNRVSGQVSTTDATPTVISTFALSATPGCYTIDGTVTGYSTGGDGLGIFFSGAIKSDGATATVIGSTNTSEYKNIAAWDMTISASGNSLLLTVIGAAATNINWDSSYTYRFVG